ncbi:MAG: acyltransferase [Rhodanobacter sp.]
MNQVLPTAAPHRRNNFDGLRLIAASMVLFSHQFVILGAPEPAPFGDSFGALAVMMFFVMSGYLVAESWYHDPHLMRFALRRLLRIWPALVVATIAIALAAAAVTTLPLHEYLGAATGRFVIANAEFRTVHPLPGVFATSPPNANLSSVNASWWTIPMEAHCYAYLAIMGLIGLRRRWVSIVAFLLVLLMYLKTLPGHARADAFDNISDYYIAFFMTGVCARQFAGELRRAWVVVLGAGILCVAAAVVFHQHRLGEWAVMSPLTLLLGARSTPGIRSAARFGDLSYGIYLYAYFVQQLSVRVWPAVPSYSATVAVALIATVLLAWCSWHLVEAPALRLKRHLHRWFPDGAA